MGRAGQGRAGQGTVGYDGFLIFQIFEVLPSKDKSSIYQSNQIIFGIKTYTQQGVPNDKNVPNKDPLDISNISSFVNPDG